MIGTYLPFNFAAYSSKLPLSSLAVILRQVIETKELCLLIGGIKQQFTCILNIL
jgi:hypothetical protein